MKPDSALPPTIIEADFSRRDKIIEDAEDLGRVVKVRRRAVELQRSRQSVPRFFRFRSIHAVRFSRL